MGAAFTREELTPFIFWKVVEADANLQSESKLVFRELSVQREVDEGKLRLDEHDLSCSSSSEL